MPVNTLEAELIPAFDGSGSFYVVQPGDNLTTIIRRWGQLYLMREPEAVKVVAGDNPQIENVDLIYPNQLIFLRHRNAVGNELSPPVRQEMRETISILGSTVTPELGLLARNSNAVSIALGVSENAGKVFGGIVAANGQALSDLAGQHAAYRAAGVSRAGYRQFSAARADVLSKIQRDFGRAAKPLLGQTPKEAGRLAPGLSKNPTARMTQSAARLGKVSTALKAGGFVAQAVSIGVTAEVTRQDVCRLDTREDKNRALVGGGGSVAGSVTGGIIGGAVGTAIVGVALGSNPAGWAVLLVVGVAGAAGGYFGDKAGKIGAQKVYDELGNGYDLVEATGVEALCR